MQVKPCRICHTEHFNNGELCSFCTEEKHAAFELRLVDSDKAVSFAVVSGWALHGPHETQGKRWMVG
jgi:hypothetical protein